MSVFVGQIRFAVLDLQEENFGLKGNQKNGETGERKGRKGISVTHHLFLPGTHERGGAIPRERDLGGCKVKFVTLLSVADPLGLTWKTRGGEFEGGGETWQREGTIKEKGKRVEKEKGSVKKGGNKREGLA